MTNMLQWTLWWLPTTTINFQVLSLPQNTDSTPIRSLLAKQIL
ncbi:hypothetical protein [Secundilactobacillus paracollinoides]|nr:hypothetical protein [Secundilactobacillus paracollinoides]